MGRDRHDHPEPDPSPERTDDDLVEAEWFATGRRDPDGIDDVFAPPADPCECYCLHCGRVFMSDEIWWQRVVNSPNGFRGVWMCPTPNCDGKGFTFDIFPTDPLHPANADCGGCDEDDPCDDAGVEAWEDDAFDDFNDPDAEYDPTEPQYAAMDEDAFDEIEGEEWKYGLQPGERLPEPEWHVRARLEWEERQKRFDEPDERPRIVDASDEPVWGDRSRDREDDIPF